jgi:hypothetical protein
VNYLKIHIFQVRFLFRTETELKIRNQIERKMQDNQPNVEKEKWLSVWGFELTSSEAQLFNIFFIDLFFLADTHVILKYHQFFFHICENNAYESTYKI